MYLILMSLALLFSLTYSEEHIKNTLPEKLSPYPIIEDEGKLQTMTTDAKKSKVKKRPGAPYPVPSIIPSSIESDVLYDSSEDNLPKNSSTVPRKGAGDPPPFNETSISSNIMNDAIPTPPPPPSTTTTTLGTNLTINLDNKDKNQTINSSTTSDNFKNLTNTENTNNTKSSNVTKQLNINENLKPVNDSKVVENIKNNDTNITPTLLYKPVTLKPTDSTEVHSNITTSHSDSQKLLSELSTFQYTSKKPATASAEDDHNKTSSTAAIIVAILIICLICSLIGYVAYKRIFSYWNRRHYSRVDFLIDGLYEM